ncbi:ATP phosphoribosyltransferase regulatory subunit [Bacillus paralicheniformis]|uniref:ATP phosphoribosyltransferase regulatory subunit n=1 Tax=Bacillus paralicheniformis TaxID=1648923 RepID=A0A7Z1B546_9BACI|nr:MULTISPECIES: ATP phosphoribosyltransferase regulatory subunit [Bacillus]ETB71701.1 ATP phosphoribosyltransferase [Bacillus sp. CPSM8]MBC8621479.1 ATP phosphoribosyltransferase regulatory subunit [Robertmurraya crescens]POO81373.1 ATP phosphoribosyltransferase regulatory subunit [Bacillus sp. MBGLi97]AUZ40615.1 ATP phosphoribosyltransferase regulatory subunit [Bacillus sp. MBGLi79]KAA0837000.1 ATP phosphoribosyltransferase regulatory subunit [Bacillus paralicheniformis]
MFMFEKPHGMRDTLPVLYETKKKVRSSLTEVMALWGYQFMETPALEFYDTVGVQSAILDQQLFKLLDQEGQTLVLRPDMTAPIARVAASKLHKDDHPLRVGYAANVFRAQEREGGRAAEFEQVGVELIGDGSTSADAEVIALVIFSLKNAGLTSFKISIGHVGISDALFVEVLGNEERAHVLRRYLYEKNYVGYREHVKSLNLSSIDKSRLLELLELRGGIETCGKAASIIDSEKGKRAVSELKTLWETLGDYGCTDDIKLDLGMVSHMSYYTGVLFEIYAENVGFPIGNGGRYDQLLGRFDSPAPATGFGIRTDRLLEALKPAEEQEKIDVVIFSTEQRKEAIKFAEEERRKGKKVVIQDLAGIGDIDQMTKSFQNVTYFIGARKEEKHG